MAVTTLQKHTTLKQIQDFSTALQTAADERFMKKGEGANYTLKKQASAEEGYFATYQLNSVTEESGSEVLTPVGDKINIPKDYVVKEVTKVPLTVTAEDKAAGGIFENDDDFQVGDKYIRFTVNVKDAATVADTYMYINLNSLVDAYTGGNGIDISNSNVVSVKIDTANANGLATTANGLKLDLAVAADTAQGIAASAGAMSGADKTKLDGIETASDAEFKTEVLDNIWPATP